MLPMKKYDVPHKSYFNDIGLVHERDVGNGLSVRIENDEWGRFIRILDENKMTLLLHLVIHDEELESKIKEAIELVK